MPIDVAAASYLLSALASTGKIIEFGLSLSDRYLSSEEVKAAVKSADEYGLQKFPPDSAATRMIAASMSEDIEKALRAKAEREKMRSIKAISEDGISSSERTEVLTKSRREMCWVIEQIKRHRGGVLPPDLEEEWKMLGCADFNF